MFNFLKQIFGSPNKKLNSLQSESIRKAVEAELRDIPSRAKSISIQVMVNPNIPTELAKDFLGKLEKEYGDRLKKRLILLIKK